MKRCLISSQLKITSLLKCDEYKHINLILEGGSVDSDGQGSLLTTRHCLLNPNRNPSLSAAEIETQLKDLLNIERILWLSEGLILGDDTDSHIDMLARFTDINTIVYTACNDESDEHFLPLQAMKQELEGFTCKDGTAYNLKALPIPKAIYNDAGERLPASYANFLIINKAVLLPVYDDPNDQVAINVLQSCFQDREIIPINARPAIAQGGSLHCLTMQLTTGALNECL